jgi:hypothetical protein
MSLSVEALQFESAAPKRVPTVIPPVEDALVKLRTLAVKPLAVREDTVVVARNVWLDTERLVVEALERVVFPVTVSAEEKTPVVPVIAPSIATVE